MAQKSFDGTDKGGAGGSPGILYHLENQATESGRKLRQEVLDAASDNAKAFFMNGDYDPLRKRDAADMDESEWHDYRATYLGASDAAVAMGLSPYSSNVDLYHQKRGEVPIFPESEEDRLQKERIFSWGHIAETYLRAYILTMPEFKGCKVLVDSMIFGWPDAPYLACNLDAILQWPDGRYSLLEFKAPGEYVADEYENNNVPTHYFIQCQQQMSLLNIDDCYLLALFNRDTVTCSHIVRDMDEGMDIINSLERAWTQIMAGDEPELMGKTSTVMMRTANKWRPFAKKKEIVPLPADVESSLDQAYTASMEEKRLNDLAKVAKANKEAAVAPILLMLGENTCGVLQGSVWKYSVRCTDIEGKETLKADALERIKSQDPDLYKLLHPYLSMKNTQRRYKIIKTPLK